MIGWLRRIWSAADAEINPRMPPPELAPTFSGEAMREQIDREIALVDLHPFDRHRRICAQCDRGFDPCAVGRELLRG